MSSPTPSESRSAEVKQAAHMGRVAERADRIATLKTLLTETDKATVLAALADQGYRFEEGFDQKDLPAIQDAMREAIAQMEDLNGEVAGLATAINKGIVKAGEPVALVEGTEQLDESLTACLEQLRRDFDRGIVRINEKSTPKQYAMALKADKTAGQKWETLEARLRANGADLLKKAAAMPEGACLVGVYENGELAIRQRSQEIMNARWTEDWKDGEMAKGELKLLPHAEAVACPKGRWAKAGEIVRAVKGAGYHVPADSPNYEKEGLVAASEAVTGGHYVMSPDGKEWRSAMLECDENVPDSSDGRVVLFFPDVQEAFVLDDGASFRGDRRGAVLWLRG